MFTNLIENGLRFSKQATGTPAISIKLDAQRDDRGYFLNFQDEGPGINRDKVSRIFDPFFTTGSGGIGLGLYVAKELCEVNFASVHYLYKSPDSDQGWFQVSFRAVEEPFWD